MTAHAGMPLRGVVLSDETLEQIRQRAMKIHHGEIKIYINVDKPRSVDIEFIDRERMICDG